MKRSCPIIPVDFYDSLPILARLLIAGLCANILALQLRGTLHNAPVLTVILVAVGAALFSQIPVELSQGPQLAVIIAVSIFSAGILMQQGNRALALKLASSVWISGAVGLAVGTGHYTVGLVVTLASAFILLRIKIGVEE